MNKITMNKMKTLFLITAMAVSSMAFSKITVGNVSKTLSQKYDGYIIELTSGFSEDYVVRLTPSKNNWANNRFIYEDTESISIYPSQVVLKPNKKKKIRVFINEKHTEIETIYSILIDNESFSSIMTEKEGVNIRNNIRALLRLSPTENNNKPPVFSIKQSKNKYYLSVKNESNVLIHFDPKESNFNGKRVFIPAQQAYDFLLPINMTKATFKLEDKTYKISN